MCHCKWKGGNCPAVLGLQWSARTFSQRCWCLHSHKAEDSGVPRFSSTSQVFVGRESIFTVIILPQAGILSHFISKIARPGQSSDGKPPRKTEVLQEVVWVI